MTIQLYLTVLIINIAVITPAHGQLLSNEDNPSLLDRVLQVVWEPSSLIRMWVGLDQLYNIALSWRTVAKKLASLPFGEGRSMDHVKLQEPRHIKYYKPSVASQWDRFNKIYASSNLSPIVSDARNRLVQQHVSNAIFQPPKNYAHNSMESNQNPSIYGLPPPFLFKTQDVLVNPEYLDLSQNENEIEPLLPFENGNDPLAVSKYLELQKLENQKILMDNSYSDQTAGAASLVPSVDLSSVSNVSPQERLNRLLKLLKTLGEMQDNLIRRESSDTSKR